MPYTSILGQMRSALDADRLFERPPVDFTVLGEGQLLRLMDLVGDHILWQGDLEGAEELLFGHVAHVHEVNALAAMVVEAAGTLHALDRLRRGLDVAKLDALPQVLDLVVLARGVDEVSGAVIRGEVSRAVDSLEPAIVQRVLHERLGRSLGVGEVTKPERGAADADLALHAWLADQGIIRAKEEDLLVGEGDALTIRDILEFEPRDYTKVSTYAWSWALVMFLYSSPKYRDVVELLPYWMTALDPNQLFIDAIGDRWGELEFDWANFVTTLDYQYNFDASAVVRATPREYTEEELKRGVVFEIEPNKGWQSVGVTLEKGKKYRVATAGRFLFYLPCAGKTLEFEAPGATCQYISGAPAGRLLAAVAQDVEGLTFSDVYGTEASALGATNRTFQFDAFRGQTSNVARFGDVLDPLYPWNEPIQFRSSYVLIAPERDGELYLRVNGASRDLEKNRGSIKIQVKLKD